MKFRLMLVGGVLGIAITFLSQQFSWLEYLPLSENGMFIARKSLRVVLNDVFMLLIIHSWFRSSSVTQTAFIIQLVDGLILLPLYLFLKLSLEGTSEISSPYLSQLHRLIVNPTLMVLYIPAIYFQRLALPAKR